MLGLDSRLVSQHDRPVKVLHECKGMPLPLLALLCVNAQPASGGSESAQYPQLK